jgi:hypothetical protein
MKPLSKQLQDLVAGNISQINEVSRLPPEVIERAWRQSGHPRVTVAAVSVVLGGLRKGQWSLDAARIWAYFVMHGGFKETDPFSRTDLDIGYDDHGQELIAELVMRLERSNDPGERPLTSADIDQMGAMVDAGGD